MPWRLILFIVVFGIFLVFVTFNLENRCDIGFGFIDIPNVPVFLTIFASFTMGIFCSFPLVMFIKSKQKDKYEKQLKHERENAAGQAVLLPVDEPANVKPSGFKIFSKKNGIDA